MNSVDKEKDIRQRGVVSRLIEFVTRLLKVKRVSSAVIVTTALLSAIIIFITIYATQVGNFIIKANNGDYYLFLSETREFRDPQVSLSATGVDNMTNTTLGRLDPEMIKNTDGTCNSVTHLGYTFYVQNQSSMMINYNVRLMISDVYKEVDHATWIMIIEERAGTEEVKIYAKPQTQGDRIGQPEDCLGFKTTPFLSNITIFDYNVLNMRREEIVKYTVIMWLEGNDAECVNALFEGSVRMQMDFTGY